MEVRLDGEPEPLDQYVWDVRYIDAPVVRFHDGNTDGDLDGGSEEGDNTLYYTTDANWNVTALVDAETGGVVERYMYDPYGKATVLNGESGYDADGQVTEWSVDTGGSDWANEILYCGYRFDAETGLYHVRYRYYHPTLGRWIHRDPVGYFDGVNLYEYVGANPNLYSDPAGLQATPPPIINPKTFEKLMDWEIEEFRDETKGPAFDPKTGNDEAGLRARASHVLRALVACSKQNQLKEIAKQFEDKINKLLAPGSVTKPSQFLSAATSAHGQAVRRAKALVSIFENVNVRAGSGSGKGGRTDPVSKTIYLPTDRGLLGVGDPALPPGSIPPKTLKECFGGNAKPTGLMALAAEIVAEMPHLIMGTSALDFKVRDSKAREIWADIDCCCLTQLLQP